MIEARLFVSEVDTTRKILEKNCAVFKGKYVLTDKIYSSYSPKKMLNDEFLRLRTYQKNIWPKKDVIVAVKIHEQKEIGVDTEIPLKKEFDTKEEAERFIEENLLDKYKYEYEFSRTGWQYHLGNDEIDLERVDDLENFYTIEFKSDTVEGLKKLEILLQIKNTIRGSIASHIGKLILEKAYRKQIPLRGSN
jgi:adenylate cyclase class IV